MSNGNGVRIHEGLPHPLGATWDGLGVNFALFSAHATKVELCLFDMAGEREIERIELPEYTDEVWHGYLPDARTRHRLRLSRARALRARGGAPLQSEQAAARPVCEGACRRAEVGPERLRLHARRRRTTTCPSTSATARRSCPSAGSSTRPSPGARDRRAGVPWERTIVYEAHVRGFTKRHPLRARGAARHLRGARRTPEVVEYIKSLGVTAVELLPIHAFVDDSHLLEQGADATTGATTPSASSRRTRATSRRGDSRASSRRWWRTCTTPASRSSSTWSTTTPPRATSAARRCRSRASTTPRTTACCRTAALLHQRHRHRQHGEPEPPARAPDGHRQPALLGDRDARRRLPLRPRDHPRPRALWLRRGQAASSTPAGRTRC